MASLNSSIQVLLECSCIWKCLPGSELVTDVPAVFCVPFASQSHWLLTRVVGGFGIGWCWLVGFVFGVWISTAKFADISRRKPRTLNT